MWPERGKSFLNGLQTQKKIAHPCFRLIKLDYYVCVIFEGSVICTNTKTAILSLKQFKIDQQGQSSLVIRGF